MSSLPPDWPDESAQRLEKIEGLRKLGITPYPNRFQRTHTLAQVVAAYSEKDAAQLEAAAAASSRKGRWARLRS
jgi:lysyl-tRNA synthetase class II